MAPASISGKRFVGLDGLRGMAAIFVTLYHFGSATVPFLPGGYLAVDFFFVLSGFVIARNYEVRLRHDVSGIRFMAMRLIRLYPLSVIGTGIAVLGYCLSLAVGQQVTFGRVTLLLYAALALAMLPAPSKWLYPLNIPVWSLALELLINGLFVLVFWRLASRWLLAVMAVCAAILIVAVAPPHYLDVGARWNTSALGLVRITYSFLAGLIISRWWTPDRRVARRALLPFVALAAVMICPIAPDRMLLRDLSFVLLISPAIIIWGARYEVPAGLATICVWLGDLSYPLYMVHIPTTNIWLTQTRHHDLWLPVSAGIMLLLSIVVARAALRWLDAPIRHWLSRRWHLRESAVPQTVTG